MEKWARAISPKVQFLCVCVDSLVVAQLFDRMFGFEHAVNAHIPSRSYMPHGCGQLGCSGFVVSDANGNFVSRKTMAFLQHGDKAFRHVESLLAEQLSSLDPTATIIEEHKNDDPGSSVDCTPATIGIESMDHEHERCAKALKRLLQQPTVKSLRVVVEELEAHFAHEEALMVKYGCGNARGDGQFSPLQSHIQDHLRIVELGRTELKRVQDNAATLSSSSCSMGDTNNMSS